VNWFYVPLSVIVLKVISFPKEVSRININFTLHGATALVGQGLLNIEALRSHSRTHTHTHSLRILWTWDRPVADTSTLQHTTLTRDRYACRLRDSNHSLGKRADPRLISHGHGNRLLMQYKCES
jgi:hypothetical protein